MQVSKAIASSARHHVGPTACALDISDPAPCACRCTAEGGYSWKERGERYECQRDKSHSDYPIKKGQQAYMTAFPRPNPVTGTFALPYTLILPIPPRHQAHLWGSCGSLL